MMGYDEMRTRNMGIVLNFSQWRNKIMTLTFKKLRKHLKR